MVAVPPADTATIVSINVENPKFREIQGRSLLVALCILRRTNLADASVILANSDLALLAGIGVEQLYRAAEELHEEGILHVAPCGRGAREYRWQPETLAVINRQFTQPFQRPTISDLLSRAPALEHSAPALAFIKAPALGHKALPAKCEAPALDIESAHPYCASPSEKETKPVAANQLRFPPKVQSKWDKFKQRTAAAVNLGPRSEEEIQKSIEAMSDGGIQDDWAHEIAQRVSFEYVRANLAEADNRPDPNRNLRLDAVLVDWTKYQKHHSQRQKAEAAHAARVKAETNDASLRAKQSQEVGELRAAQEARLSEFTEEQLYAMAHRAAHDYHDVARRAWLLRRLKNGASVMDSPELRGLVIAHLDLTALPGIGDEVKPTSQYSRGVTADGKLYTAVA